MALIQYKGSMKSFTATIDKKLNNTLNFENCSNRQEYANPEIAVVDTTSRSLFLYDNVILSTLVDILRDSSSLRIFEMDEVQKYKFRPKRMSIDMYGDSDYWWIILAVNGIVSPLDFDNFSILLIPELNTIQREIDGELYSHPITTTYALR